MKDVNVFAAEIPNADADTLRLLADKFREKYPKAGAAVLVTGTTIIGVLTEDLVKRGLKAGDLITGIGGMTHLATEYFAAEAKIKMVGVPYTAEGLANAKADLEAQTDPQADTTALMNRYPKAVPVSDCSAYRAVAAKPEVTMSTAEASAGVSKDKQRSS